MGRIEKRCRTIFLLLRKRLKRLRTKLEEAQNDKEDITALAKLNLDKIQKADGYYYIDNKMKCEDWLHLSLLNLLGLLI